MWNGFSSCSLEQLILIFILMVCRILFIQFVEHTMKNQNLAHVLKSIALMSSSIRNMLTAYGYSQYEIDRKLIELLPQTQSREELLLPSPVHTNQDNSASPVDKKLNLERVLAKILSNQQKDVKSYLVKFLSSLELQVRSLEEYQQYCKQSEKLEICGMKSTNESSDQSDESIKYSQKSIQSGQQSSVLSSFYKKDKESSTQIQSLESQQSKLKDSLRNIIEKTKILREMMQRQLLLNSVEEFGVGRMRRYSSFSPFSQFQFIME